jgi:hypothetical protein
VRLDDIAPALHHSSTPHLWWSQYDLGIITFGVSHLHDD